MVNKTDFSAQLQSLEATLLIQELMAKYPMQIFASLAKIGGSDISLPSKIAHELLLKDPPQGSSKLANLVTLMPSLKHLSQVLLPMVEMATKERGSPAKPTESNSGLPAQVRGEALEGEGKDLRSARLPNPLSGEKIEVGLSRPAMLANMKVVLAVLYYFANHIDTLKPDSLEAFERMMKPLIDQLIQPIKKNSEGELESGNREIPKQEKIETTPLKEKSIPLPLDSRQRAEKSMNDHRVDQNPGQRRSLDVNSRHIASPLFPRAQDFNSPKPSLPSSDLHLGKAEAKATPPPSTLTPQDRISIPAAPFSPEHSISTAPRKAKKTQKQLREEEEDLCNKDEEDPFQDCP